MRTVARAAVVCLLLAACSPLATLEVQPIELEPIAAPETSYVYAADGSLIATLRFANREVVTRDQLPQVLVDAVVAAEDRRFWEHDGIDLRAIVRAAVANQQAGEVVQGGSTLTQQLVKNRYFAQPETTLERKAIEAHLALQLEREATKDEILVDYLNTIYLGAGAYGIEAAARTYFDVATRDLDLSQAALLAGLIRSPESASPFNAPQRAVEERRRVLASMAAEGVITRDQERHADAAPLGVGAPPEPPQTRFPHFVEYVKRALVNDPTFGPDEASRWRRLFGGGLRIHTTIDPHLQGIAEAASTAFFSAATDPEVGIAVVRPATGELVASVGGRDFAASQFDLATQARRQPGSTFKVFALAAALSSGHRLDQTIDSGSVVLEVDHHSTWSVASGTTGELTLREALVRSSNGAFARLAVQLGPELIAAQAHAMGITSDIGSNASIVLGGLRDGVSPLEMAGAFATLANGGVHLPPRSVSRITDAADNVVWAPDIAPRMALDPATAWLVTDAMREAVERGTGQAARLDGRPAAGKTGTVQGNRDAWFVGFTPELSTAVWLGYPDAQRPLLDIHGVARVQGGDWPARIWHELMSAALADEPVRDFAYPTTQAETVTIDPLTGALATQWCPTTVELTGLPGQLPTMTCPLHTGPPPETSTATGLVLPAPPRPAAPSAPPAPPPAPSPSPAPAPTTPAPPTATPEPSPTTEPPPPPEGPVIGPG